MSTVLYQEAQREVIYPESDGQPMADNTQQFRWIVLLKENLETLFEEQADVFVAGDLLWYPVQGHTEISRAADTMVVFGRPKGDRGSYRQWEEDNIAPQVVFEVVSPHNTFREMLEKLAFYDSYGVAEYYIYNPDTNDLTGLLRQDGHLRPIAEMNGWVSPRLGIRFVVTDNGLRLFGPNGQPFESHQELARRAAQAEQERDQERAARQRAEERAARLAARLRELGIEPNGGEM